METVGKYVVDAIRQCRSTSILSDFWMTIQSPTRNGHFSPVTKRSSPAERLYLALYGVAGVTILSVALGGRAGGYPL